MKQNIYENILARKIGMNYRLGIRFETILFDVDKAKVLIKSNQSGKSN